MTRSSDSFSTVLPIVNGGDCGCIVRYRETIIVLVLLAFNLMLQTSHHSLTLPRSLIRGSANVTLTPVDGTTAIKVESSIRILPFNRLLGLLPFYRFTHDFCRFTVLLSAFAVLPFNTGFCRLTIYSEYCR